MKKIFTFFIFCALITFIITNSIEIIDSIKLSFSICINNLFPSLIPFMLLSNILINYNFVNDISEILNKLMTKIFRVNKNCAFAFIMSIMSGTPSNAKYLKDLYNSKLISINDINKCLKFCHFTNPIFILGTIGYTFLNNKKLGLIILISHFLSSFIIGFILRGKKLEKSSELRIKKQKDKNFINILNDSINSTINTLFLILGIITVCLIITSLINKIINIPQNFKFIFGIIEITQGLKYLSLSNLSIELKTIISSFLVSFGGFCIHLQTMSILENKKIRYIPYLISRLIQGLISSIITIMLLYLLRI